MPPSIIYFLNYKILIPKTVILKDLRTSTGQGEGSREELGGNRLRE